MELKGYSRSIRLPALSIASAIFPSLLWIISRINSISTTAFMSKVHFSIAFINSLTTLPQVFPILSGALQGSPPSSLLYLLQAQPLLALIRRMAATGAVQPVTLPFGGAAPLCHMHADDTTIHAASPADCDKIIAGPVAVFTAASGAQLNPTKTKTLLFGSILC